MSNGRHVPPKQTLSMLDQAHSRDRQTFALFPERVQFRRAYIPGEWPSGDNTPLGPLTWVVVSSPVPGGYIWQYITESSGDQETSFMVTEGDTPLAHMFAIAALKGAITAAGGDVWEVR